MEGGMAITTRPWGGRPGGGEFGGRLLERVHIVRAWSKKLAAGENDCGVHSGKRARRQARILQKLHLAAKDRLGNRDKHRSFEKAPGFGDREKEESCFEFHIRS